MHKRRLLTAALLLAVFAQLFAAGLSVPDLSLITTGELEDSGRFVLATRINIDMVVEGGAKFAAMFKLGFRNPSLESYFSGTETPLALPAAPTPGDLAGAIERIDDATGVGLRTVAVTIGDLFSIPLELSVFVGHYDVFASGDDFPRLFGTDVFATKLRGFMYYPDGIGGDGKRCYNGLHEAFGTGLRFALNGLPVQPYLYLYQDSWLGAGYYSADARVLINGPQVKMELFAGASFPVSTTGAYRGGLLFYFNPGAIGDFYLQVGIPYWAGGTAFSMESMSFMFEPRIHFGAGSLTMSFFYHPAYYLQTATREGVALDLRADLMFGNVNKSGKQGGLEARLYYDPNRSTGALRAEVAPYYQAILHGVRWDLKLNTQVLPAAKLWYGMFSPSIGVTTSF